MINIFIEAKDKKTPEYEFLKAILNNMGIPSDSYNLIPTNGYKNLMDSVDASNINEMRANTDVGEKNIVVFDADTETNQGGFAIRREELLKRKTELGLEFELFLWPDNKSDGDVEILMESIARKDLYPEFFDCFGKYERCISKRRDEEGAPFYSTPNRKGKLHTYFTSLPVSKTKKRRVGSGSWLWDNADIWNLDSASLIPIKEFLSNFFH